jgi:hypothetical protein
MINASWAGTGSLRLPPASERKYSLKSKLAMGTKADQLQNVLLGLTVDQNYIEFYVTIPMVFPFAGQRMIAILGRQWGACCFNPFVITLEGVGAFNPPHSGQSSVLRR